jgi:23S rRNA pseudoU1915 N3-methylase RlmH
MRAYPAERKRVPTMMIHLGPNRSYTLPTKTRERAQRVVLRKNAKEIEARFQPNSAIMGLNITPKEYRAPELKKRMANEAARTYQP